jgi:hypothetical protein
MAAPTVPLQLNRAKIKDGLTWLIMAIRKFYEDSLDEPIRADDTIL